MKRLTVPIVVFLVTLIIPVVLSVRMNDGIFVYTLDDPYIHLAISENITEGFYGINASEYTAPSSSILWPFLLTPFVFSSFFYLAPFFLNSVFALLTIFLLYRYFGKDWLIFSVVSIFAFNMVGLVLTGMEHSLQLLLVVVVAVGLKGFMKNQRISFLLASALVLAPLVRYECLAVSLPVFFFLFLAGEKKKSVLLFLVMVVLLSAFSLFLVSLGLDPMPASVNAKSAVVSGAGSAGAMLGNLIVSLKSFRGIVQLFMLIPLVFVLFSRSRTKLEKLLACSTVIAVMLHLIVGRSGWFHRYGVYMWCFSFLMIFQLYRGFFHKYQILSGLLLLLLSADYLSGYTKIPSASSNIYQQQYQMRRFVHLWLDEPVAVNDLGLISMGYDRYILDLWGLATPSALQGAFSSAWVDSAAMANNVNYAIVYKDELPGIQHWTTVARMQIRPPLVVCVSGGIDFLAAPWVSDDSLRVKLIDFSTTLPEGIDMEVFR